MNISENKELVPGIAEQLILELFAGQTKELQVIKTKVEEIHKQRGGLPFTSKYHPVQIALTKLEKSGVVEDLQLGYWSIPIRKLEDFINWAKQFQEGDFVFRGVPNAAFEIQASASLRPHVIEQMYIEKQHDEEKGMYCLRFFGPLPKGRLCYNNNLFERSIQWQNEEPSPLSLKRNLFLKSSAVSPHKQKCVGVIISTKINSHSGSNSSLKMRPACLSLLNRPARTPRSVLLTLNISLGEWRSR